MSDSDDDNKTSKSKRRKNIDKKKLYKHEEDEKYNLNKNIVKNTKKFDTAITESNSKEENLNKINIKESNSDSDSSDSSNIKKKKKKESSSDSSSSEVQKKKIKSDSSSSSSKPNKSVKKRVSSSSSHSNSRNSNDSDDKKKSNKKDKIESLNNIIIKIKKPIEIKIKEKEKPISMNDDKKFLKEKKENEENQITDKLISNITENLKNCEGQLEKEMKEIRKNYKFFEDKNFILTDLSCRRMAEIIHYIKSGNPVLLEGPTGTAKTRTSVIACEYLMELSYKKNNNSEEGNKNENLNEKEKEKNSKKKCNYIKFNLSAETKIDNLMNKYVGDNKSISGIKIEGGAFYKAFTKGKILILDEINLASKEVLDCIGQALDNRVLSTELTGKQLKKYDMDQKFALIATQNPLKGSFINKRQNLGYAFFSRFQKVNCDKFTENELFEIAKGLAKKEKINVGEDILKNIIKFHIEWEKESSKDIDDIFCFTIREIETVLNALKDKNNSLYSIIMNVYGARYRNNEKEKIIKILNQEQYENLKEKEIKKQELPKNFPKCFVNDNLTHAVNSALFSLNNGRHVIFVGEEGSGITQVARWTAEFFSQKNPYLCICSKKLQCEDLIGITVPNFSNKFENETSASETEGAGKEKEKLNEILKFKEGFLIKAIKRGRSIIFDQINEAPSTVYERLNGLLDKKYNDEDNTFPVPEYSEKTIFKIKKNFRIICTCNNSKLKNISPAFLSRFDIVYLEDQLDKIQDFNDLVKKILLRFKELEIYERERIKKRQMNCLNEEISFVQENIDDSKDDLFYSFTDNLINLIIGKIKLLKNDEKKIYSNYSISSISKFCYSVYKLLLKFREKSKEIKEEEIVNIVFDLRFLKNPDEIKISNYPSINSFISDINENIKNSKDIEEKYSFDSSEKLKNFVGIVYLSSLINLYLCIESPPGYGKTTSARAIAEMREIFEDSDKKFYIQTFHSSTYPQDLYGTSTIINNQINFNKGPLTRALIEGKFYIADELNISPISTILSIAPILELIFDTKIYIPGMVSYDKEFIISSTFFLIICQNNVGIIGRSELPSSLKRKIRKINYPELEDKEIEKICNDIDNFLSENNKNMLIGKEESEKIGRLMIEINKEKIFQEPWSLRDVTKLIKRLQYQKEKKNTFPNFQIQHNLLFYALSRYTLDDKYKYLDKFCQILKKKETLNLDEQKINDLKETFKSETKLIEEENDEKISFILKKKDLKIILYENNKNDKNKDEINTIKKKYKDIQSLYSLLESIFQMKLTSYKEPILLIGPTCYKTFAAKIILENATIVSLNRESTVLQLLGSPFFFSKSEHKDFCITQIYEILGLNNLKKKLKECKEWENNKNKIENEINSKIGENTIYSHLKINLVENIKKKLFSVENENRLIDLKMEFKPGLILSAIFNDKSLILKNLSKVKTSVLERFNELFSDKNILTLSEDTTNTFTSDKNKELKNFNNFRIIATSSLNDEITLSESILSRFTKINVEDYNNNEKKIVLTKKAGEDIDLINELNPDLTLPEILNAIRISKLLDDYKKVHKKNLQLIFFILENGKKEKKENLDFSLNEKYQISDLKDNDFPFNIEYEENKIISKRTELKYDYNYKEDPKILFKNIYFTKKFSEICDLIHFACSLNVPLILEGDNGQGKKTAINLMAQFLGLNIIHKVLSKSSKSDELLMNMIITKENNETKIEYKKSDISEALEEKTSKKIIIFDEINNASLPVLDLLTNIIYDKKVLLPDGSELKIGNPNIIGIINRNNNESNLDKIPLNLKSNCIYHIVENPDSNDFMHIIGNLFRLIDFDKNSKKKYIQNYIINHESMNEEQRKFILENREKFDNYYDKAIQSEFDYFSKKFIDSLNFIKNNSIEPAFNLIDVKKYIDFRKHFPKIDSLYLMLFIFVYRFDKKDIQENIMKELNLNLTSDFNPSIDYDDNQKKLIIYLGNNKYDNIKLDTFISKNIDKKENKRLFKSLTKSQKLGIIFLVCCIKSEKIPLIQGETASGKSYLMNIFAKIFGQDLILYQITSNSGMSIITGQDIIKTEIEDDEWKLLKKHYNNIKEIINEKKKFSHINEEDYHLILTKIFDILNKKRSKLKNEDIKKLNEAKDFIKNIISLPGRLEHKISPFIKATTNGGWVFFDGIEMGHSILFDTISSLCSENPQLNVLGTKETIIINKKNISPNFKFFLSFNPSNLGKKTINQILYNSCARFSLNALDHNIVDSTAVIYNSRYSNEINKKLWKKICSKLAYCHQINVKQSEIFINSMAGGIKFSPRHLTFLGLDGKKNVNIPEESGELSDWVKTIFQLYYFNSFNQNTNKFELTNFQDKVYDEFIKKDNYNELENIEENELEIEVRNVLDDLCKIQKSNEQNIFNFNFKSFVQKCLKLKLKDENISLIINNIEDTINLLIYHNENNNQKYDEILSNFFQINIIKNLLKELNKNMKTMEIKNIENLSLDSNELLLRNELKLVLLKMKLLLALLNDEELFSDKLNYKIYDERFKQLIGTIQNFIDNPTKKGFRKLIKGCTKIPSSFEILDFFFPKHKFFGNENYDLIILYINTICELVRNKNNFSIEIDNNIFIYSPNNNIEYGKISAHLCLNKDRSFNLSAGTKISIPLVNTNNEFILKKEPEDSEIFIRFIYDYSSKKNITKNIIEIFNNFKKQRKKNEEKKEIFSSDYFYNPEKNNSIYSRAWGIIYGLTPKDNVYKFLLKYYFEKESRFFKFIENKYETIDDENKIEEIINYFKIRYFYYNKNSFLWMNLIKKLQIDYNLNKDDINSRLIDIRKEIDNLKILENNADDQKNVSEDKFILSDIQKQLEEKKNQIETDEKYRKAEKELNKLKNELQNLNVQSNFEIWKENLIKKINDAFNLSKEDMINQVSILQNDYNSLITINEEKMSLFKNNIDWKIPSIRNEYEKSKHIKLIDIILLYNRSLEVIKEIEEIKNDNDKSRIIKISSNLQQKKIELKSLINYIISLQDYHNFDFGFANSICKASLMLNLYKNNISIESLSNFFTDFDERKNRLGQILIENNINEEDKKILNKKNKLLQDEFIHIYKITGFYDLNMDIIIPNFKLADLIHLFFSFESSNKYYYGPIFDNIQILNKENLYEHLYKNINKEIKDLTNFKDVAGKIALIFYKYFNKDLVEIPNYIEGEKILEFIESKNKEKSSEKYAKLNALIEVIKLGIYFDKYKKYKEEIDKNKIDKNLTFEDFKCFKDKFDINAILKIKNLPSFQYFLLNNYNNIEILLKSVKKENINKLFEPSLNNYIPFWVFILRIMSSTNCLIFGNDRNPYEKELTEIIRNKILISMKEKYQTDLSWIYLTTDEIKFDNIFNKEIIMFYTFFNKICLTENYPNEFSYFINSVLINFYKSLFEIIYSSNFNDLLNTDLQSNKNQVLEFIKNPKEFIKKYINKELLKIIKDSNCLNFSKKLEDFIETIYNTKKELKEKVETIEISLKNKAEKELIQRFKTKYNRDINADEKENLFRDFDSQKIYFDQLTIDGVIVLFTNTEKLLKESLEYIKKIKNNDIIELNEFINLSKKLKKKLNEFDKIYNVEDKYCDEDFKNYLNIFQKNVNSFKNNFNVFYDKYKSLPNIDSEQIYMKDFSLPVFNNRNYIINLDEIKEMPSFLAQPFIIKSNNQLFCNYKKIYYNTGPISPELYNESCHLKIYSLVKESLNIEFENNIIINEIKEGQIENGEINRRKVMVLLDTKDKQYMKIKKNHIDPETPIDIDLYFPPPNISNEEIIYRLNRNLKVSNNESSINILIEIIYIVCPIQIEFSCEQYSLIFENGQYKINSKKLLKGEKIQFKIKNYFNHIPLNIKHTITSLDKNTYDEPKIEIKNQNEFNLTIGKNEGNENNIEDINILNCLIEIYFSEKLKIPILIDSLIISTYFEFYIYDYETENFVMNKMEIYIPVFKNECEIQLNFLVSSFIDNNIIGLFKISEVSEGITIIETSKKIQINSYEKYFAVKLKFDMTKFNDKEIAVFEFQINDVIKKIELFQKSQAIENVDLKLIKEVDGKNGIEIKNLNDIKKNSLLISPFTCWGKGTFLYRECYISGKKDLELEIPENAKLYYLSKEGYIEKEKEDNYLIIIQTKENWYSTIGLNNFISKNTFQHILVTQTNNFFEDFIKYFPNECKRININLFEALSKLFIDKAQSLIKDKENVSNLIKNNKDIYKLSINNYYYFNKDNYIFTNSKALQKLINKIKELENDIEFSQDYNNEIEEIDSIHNISNIENDDDNDIDSVNQIILQNDLLNDNNQIIINKKKSKKFLIQNGVPIKEVIKKDVNNKIENYNYGKNEINNIEITEINFIEIPKILTINSLIKFFNDCELGAIVLPLYIYKAKQSNRDEDKKNINKYFSILTNVYFSIENNNDNLISEYTNHFKKTFENMISRMKAAGYNSNLFKFNLIFAHNDDKLLFILPQQGKFKVPQRNFSKNQNKINALNQKQIEINPKKEIQNEDKKEDKKEEKEVKEVNKEDKDKDKEEEQNIINNNSVNNINEKNSMNNVDSILNGLINIFQNPRHIFFSLPIPAVPLELPKEIQKIYLGYNENSQNINKKNKKNQTLYQKEVQSNIGITGIEFDKMNFDVKKEIKTIIDNMKNSIKSQFLYKKEKNLISLENINKNLLENNEKEIRIDVQKLIDLSIPITKKIIKDLSFQNLQKEIHFNNLEINILFDSTRIINYYHKYIYFILIISLINALSYLEINYIFAVVGDSRYKAIIKDFDEPHSKEIIQRIFDCISIQRYRTNIASCLKTAIDEFPTRGENSQRVFYIFTNGLDDEYKLYDEWNKEIFNNKNSFFSFLFYLPLDEIDNENDKTFLFDLLKEFSKKCNSKNNLSTFIIKGKNDLFENNILNNNLLKLFLDPLISIQEPNLKIDILPAKFEIEVKDNLKNNIEDFKNDFNDEINYDEEEIFAKKESIEFKYSIPELNLNETNEIKLKVGKIISSLQIPNLSDFIKNYFKIPKEKINLQLLEIIFDPNLPTETILTDVGTQIDIYEFIKLCINPTPNPKIYRQLGDGFVKNYGLTILIDSSYSCLGGISRDHTINTIRYLFSALSYIDLPSFNLIISTESNPIIICSERGTLDALSNKSKLWGCLLYYLIEKYKCMNTNLSSAIRAAYNITNARKQEHTDYLFVLTDGLFQKSERKKILEEINYCYSKNLLIIGIGIGYYPYGIEKLFPYTVYSRQPNKIIEAIALSFSDSKINNSELMLKDPDYTDLKDKFDKYKDNFKAYKPETLLVEYLKEIPIFLNSFSIYADEVNNKNQDGKLQSVEGPMRNAMYLEGLFKDKKILIVMLYSAEMNLRENPYLSYKFINKPQPGKYYCIRRALEYLEIQVDYAIDYETAIEKLTENNNGYCNYYACIILSGEPYPELPKDKDHNDWEKSKPHLLGEFIKVIIQFWKNGGGLGLFSDNAPFTFQTNLILEQLFEGSLQFRVGGFHEGKKILKGVESGLLEEKGTFNRKIHIIDNYQRPLITHSLYEMYEGNTVSFIIENPKDDDILYFGKNEKLKMITNPNNLLPFIPLSKDSDGGFNSLFYCSNGDEGDIIIDCSYTKFFLEMDKTGTPRYLMNICSWLAAIEKHTIKKDCLDPINFKPKFIDIKIDWDAKYQRFMKRKDKPIEEMKTLFVVDNSGSVFNQEVYFNKVMHLFCTIFNEERGDAFYTWNEKEKKLDIYEIEQFINDMDGIKGTSSSLIAEIAKKEKNNNFEHLIIITDGDVQSDEIDKSDLKVKEYNLSFKFVSTFIIDTGDVISESVGCPYSRNCPGFTYIVDSQGNQKEQASLLEEDIQIFNNLSQIKTYDEFKLKYWNIYRFVRAKCLGRNTDIELKKKFLDFKNKIKIQNKDKNDFNKKMNEIENMINGGLRTFQPIAC